MMKNRETPYNLPKLLVVDDTALNIQTLYQIFSNDHEVFMATSGQQALDFCEKTLPDLILLDVMMPDIDGHEVCRRLKNNERTRDIPIIFVTSQNNPDEETLGLQLGAVDFISKPINSAVVRARVKTHLTLKAQNDVLRSFAFIDGLTGIANRRRFDDNLAVEWRQCQRTGAPLTLLLIDIDHFKTYNDHYGHQAGGAALRAVAISISYCFNRAHDLVARYGGEEFICLLPDCGLIGAETKSEEIRAAVARLGIRNQASPTEKFITVSVGGACVIPSETLTPEQLIVAADTLLYAAKSKGRNCVCVDAC